MKMNGEQMRFQLQLQMQMQLQMMENSPFALVVLLDSLFATQRSNTNPPNHKRILALPTQMNDIPANKEKYENRFRIETLNDLVFLIT